MSIDILFSSNPNKLLGLVTAFFSEGQTSRINVLQNLSTACIEILIGVFRIQPDTSNYDILEAENEGNEQKSIFFIRLDTHVRKYDNLSGPRCFILPVVHCAPSYQLQEYTKCHKE